MFKQKNSIFYLLPIVLIIWGVIAWRIIGYKEIRIDAKNTKNSCAEAGVLICDSLILNLNYRDPFLDKDYLPALTRPVKLERNGQRNNIGSEKTQNNTNTIRNSIIQKNQSNEKPTAPEWSYIGLVRSNKTGKQIGILRINGIETLIRQDESIHGWLVSEMDSNKASLTKENHIVTLKKRTQ